MRRNIPRACALLVCLLLLPRPALAWNSTGHKLVARIAWSHLKTPVRNRIVELLTQAPHDADLANMFAETDDPHELPAHQRDFFVRASIWADIVRDKGMPERMEKYHHRDWHFIDILWGYDQAGQPVDTGKIIPDDNAIIHLKEFVETAAADGGDPADKAVAVAWILHLVGDIHQPLHASGRVTKSQPNGDAGGNGFCLDEEERCYNLHSYWDGIFDRRWPQRQGESHDRYLQRLTGLVMRKYKRRDMESRLKPGEYMEWARESQRKAKAEAYPKSLKRFQLPSIKYRNKAYLIAEESAALAGYRLAATLNAMFDR
jgi:hypothetical protein